MMDASSAAATLRLYNSTVQELLSLQFVRQVKEQGNIGFSIGGGYIQHYPHGEELRSFVLTFRLFIQNRDGLSLEMMEKVYELDQVYIDTFDRRS